MVSGTTCRGFESLRMRFFYYTEGFTRGSFPGMTFLYECRDADTDTGRNVRSRAERRMESIIMRGRNIILDNIRYIISVILLLCIVFILVKCTGKEKSAPDADANAGNVVVAEDEQPDVQEPVEVPNDLVQDAYPEVNRLLESYFEAKAAGDTDTLRQLVSVLDDSEAQSIQKMSEHIESYNNITCYTKNGPAEGSYAVYVCYDIKFKNVDTMAPSLNMYYVCTAEDGSLYMDTGEWDAQTEAAIVELNSQEDVQNLVAQVDEAYNNALSQDEKLSNLAATIQAAASQDEGEASSGQEGEAAAQENPDETAVAQETVYAKETVNVRSQADENSDRIGQMAQGDSAVRISEDENGWSQISYNNSTAYVKSEYLTTNKDEIGAASASESPSSGTARIIETAKMRTGEDTGSELIETLFPGTTVEVLEKLSSGRSKISCNGKTGYVNSECIGK